MKGVGKSTGLFHLVALVMTLCLFYPASSYSAPGEQVDIAQVKQEIQNEWKVIAVSPGVEVVKDAVTDPGEIVTEGENPLDLAYDWLDEQGLQEGMNLRKGKILYVSIGTAVVNAPATDPKFIDSRFLAYQRAELEAKAKIAIYLGVDLTTSRGTSERDIDPQERKALQEIINASPVLEQNARRLGIWDRISKLFNKAIDVADAKLDRALENEGIDVKGRRMEEERTRRAAKARRDRLSHIRNISQASFKAAAAAFAEIQGMQTIQTVEGPYHGGYQVVVVGLWSQNMQRLVEIMRYGVSPQPLPRRAARKALRKQLPKDPAKLSTLSGVKVYLDEKGRHTVLAFGQAPVEVIGGRADKAYERAEHKARLRAMAAIRNFMGEQVAFQASEELAEALALYANEYAGAEGGQEYHSISQFQERIRGYAEKQNISGISALFSKEVSHPFTGKKMILKVMQWSPRAQYVAYKLFKSMKYGSQYGTVEPYYPPKTPGSSEPDTPRTQDPVMGPGADPDAY